MNFRGPDSLRVPVSGFVTQAKTKCGGRGVRTKTEKWEGGELYTSRDGLGKGVPHSWDPWTFLSSQVGSDEVTALPRSVPVPHPRSVKRKALQAEDSSGKWQHIAQPRDNPWSAVACLFNVLETSKGSS